MKLIQALVLTLSAMATSQALALSPISGAQACNNVASSSTIGRCLNYASGVSGMAAAACSAVASSSTISDCMANAYDKNIQPSAAAACAATASSSTIAGCIGAIGNKRFDEGIVSSCQGRSSSSTIARCFNSANYTAWPNLGGDPVATSPSTVCNRLSGADNSTCFDIVRSANGEAAFNTLAVGTCNRTKTTALILSCMRAIASMKYQDGQVMNCANSATSHEQAISCLASVGTPISQDEHRDDSQRVCEIGRREIRKIQKEIQDARKDIADGFGGDAQDTLEALSQKLGRCLKGRDFDKKND